MDIVLKNCRWPDFDKNMLVRGNIGIEGGKIAAMGDFPYGGAKVIDAKGAVASPGFIDIHMHEEDFPREGERYIIAEGMLKMGVTTCLAGNCGSVNGTVKGFRETIEKLGGAPVNYLILSGYNTHRREVTGAGPYDAISKEQTESIAAKLNEDMREGAIGMSFGIEYDPGITEEEADYALSLLDDRDAFISIHYRADSSKSLDSIEEMIRMAKKCGMRYQISHLSSCSAMGQMKDALRLINEAVRENPLLNYDTYPYDAFCTEIGSTVFDDPSCFASWGKDCSCVLLSSGKFAGQTLTMELLERARREDPDALAVTSAMNEEEIAAAIVNKPCGMVASDGVLQNGLGHPRAAGTFPRVLAKYVREEGRLTIVEALRRMTLIPAERLGLSRKGRIALGADADITLFDPERIKDCATYMSPMTPPEGILAVLVSGKVAVFDGDVISRRLGRFMGKGDIA